MKILVINSGSSSLKFQLVKIDTKFQLLAKGIIDGIKLKSCKFSFKSEKKNIGTKVKIKNHEEALKLTLETLINSETIKNYKEIKAVGHRVVHGGEKYTNPTKIDKSVIKEIKKLSKLAPLHNPANLDGITACKKLLGKTPQVAVFDTAFHQTMPEKAYYYPLPEKFYKKDQIRRYGFHGTSHKYVVVEARKLFKKKKPKIISCHLGNGASITATLNGESIDTSMGFTPLEGIPMGTRSGSIDPAIALYLQRKKKLTPEKIDEILNKKSGLKALSQVSSDMRIIYEASLKNNIKAIRAMDIYCYQIAKFIGAYTAALNGLDALIFTGGIGENAFYIRKSVCEYLGYLEVKVSKKENENNELIISTPKSKVKVFAVPTNEEKAIAMETKKLLKK